MTLIDNTLPPVSPTSDQLIPPTKVSSKVGHHPSYLHDYICNSLSTSTQFFKDTFYPFFIHCQISFHITIHIPLILIMRCPY